jgi:hypothetical protein
MARRRGRRRKDQFAVHKRFTVHERGGIIRQYVHAFASVQATAASGHREFTPHCRRHGPEGRLYLSTPNIPGEQPHKLQHNEAYSRVAPEVECDNG